MEMLLEPSQAQMNGQWKRHSGREKGERVDLRLAKDKDTCAHKKGVVRLFTPATAAEPSAGVSRVPITGS